MSETIEAASMIVRQCKRWTVITSVCLLASCGGSVNSNTTVPTSIMQIMQKPVYRNASWSMQVVDLDSGGVI